MGKRLHVVKRQAQYGDTEAFNWSFEEFHKLMELFSEEVSGDEYDDDWEMPVEDYKKAMDFIKKLEKTKDPVKERKLVEDADIDYDDLMSYINTLQSKEGELLSNMQAFYRERDKHSSWIAFSAW